MASSERSREIAAFELILTSLMKNGAFTGNYFGSLEKGDAYPAGPRTRTRKNLTHGQMRRGGRPPNRNRRMPQCGRGCAAGTSPTPRPWRNRGRPTNGDNIAGAIWAATPAQIGKQHIVDEYLNAMRQMALDDAHELVGYGVPIKAIIAVYPARATIAFDCSGERLQLNDVDKAALITPVCCVDPKNPDAVEAPDPLSVANAGAVVDLLAFRPEARNSPTLRLGNAPLPGAVEPQYLAPAPVLVHPGVTEMVAPRMPRHRAVYARSGRSSADLAAVRDDRDRGGGARDRAARAAIGINAYMARG